MSIWGRRAGGNSIGTFSILYCHPDDMGIIETEFKNPSGLNCSTIVLHCKVTGTGHHHQHKLGMCLNAIQDYENSIYNIIGDFGRH